MRRTILASMVLALVLGAVWVWGQARTGEIYGTVTDPGGKPLPGVTVTLTSSVIGKLVVITDIDGNYRFPSLPPAKDYKLRFELEGFRTLVRENLEVRIGFSIRQDAQLAPGGGEELVVRGETPIVDIRKTTVTSNFTRELLQSIPTGRDPWTVLALAPGVMLDRVDVGGSQAGQQSSVWARGDDHNAQWFYDGIETTEFSYAAANYFDFDAFEEMQVVTGGNDVEVLSGGVAINIVTKRGSNRTSVGGRFYITPEAFQSENIEGVQDRFIDPTSKGNRIDHIYDFGGNLSGPFLRDHIWYWAGYGSQVIDKIVPVATGQEVHDKTTLRIANVKFNAQFGKHLTELLVFFRDKIKIGRDAGPTRPPETTYDQYSPSPMFKIQDEFFATDNLFLSFRAGIQIQNWGLRPEGGLDKPVILDEATGIWHNTYYWLDRETPAPHFNATGIYYLSGWLGGDHEFKFGAEFRRRNFLDESGYGNGVQWRYDDLSRPELGGVIRYYRPLRVNSYWQRYSLYFQDTYSVGRLTMLAGLRFDIQQNGLQDAKIDAHPLRPDLFPPASVKGRTLVTWRSLSPRFGITFDVTGTASTILKANFALFPDTLAQEEPRNISPTNLRQVRFEWIGDLNGNGIPDDDELGEITYADFDLEHPLREVNAIADDYTWPRSIEFTVGLEQKILEDLGVAIQGFYRRYTKDRFTYPYDPDNPGINPIFYDCWQEYGRLDDEFGGWPYFFCTERKPPGVIWMNQPDYHRNYLGVEFRITKRMSHGWMGFASVTLQDMRQYYEGRRSYVDPTNIDQLDGNQYWVDVWGGTSTRNMTNTQWMVKMGAAVRLPLDIFLAGTLVGQQGNLFLPYIRVKRTSNGWGSRVNVYTEEVGKERFPNIWILTLRLEKRLDLGDYGRAYISVDGFNILNSNTELQMFRIANSTLFRRVAEIVAPRIFRVGVRYEF